MDTKMQQKNIQGTVTKPLIVNTLIFISVIIYVSAFFAGLILGNKNEFTSRNHFDLAIVLAYWFSGFITGTFFFALAKIIELLAIIAAKANFGTDKIRPDSLN